MPSLAHGRTEMAHIDNEREERKDRDLTRRDGDGGALITQWRCAEVKRGREGGRDCVQRSRRREPKQYLVSDRIRGRGRWLCQTRKEGETRIQ